MRSPRAGAAFAALALLAGLLAAVTNAAERSGRSPRASADGLAGRATFAQIPASFEANVGQWDPAVRYAARASGHTLFLTTTGAVLASNTSSIALIMRGAATPLEPKPESRQPGVVNYLVGNDPSRWHVDVPTYAEVRYPSVYPGVDLVWRGTQAGLEYDFVVQPGADPTRIALTAEGASAVRVADGGDLVFRVGNNELRHQRPSLYQELGHSRRAVDGGYALNPDGSYGFRVGRYDRSKTLVIDPLVFSTFLGGTAADDAQAVAIDADGNVYVGGNTVSTDFPVTAGVFQGTKTGINDVFVTKLNPSATGLVYSTYIGGNQGANALGLGLDSARNVLLAGNTTSTNFPVTAGAISMTNAGGADGFVVRLNATGSALLYSTYLGGSANENVEDAAFTADGVVYVGGQTSSTNFPTTAGAFQTTAPAGSHAFIAKVDTVGGSLSYSTYLHGTGNDDIRGVAVDASGFVVATGATTSSDFPTTAGSFQPAKPSSQPAGFVTKLNAAGSAPIFSTYMGASSQTSGEAAAVDASGNAYIAGASLAADFPTTAGAFRTTKPNASGSAGFVAKLNSAGSALTYSTWLNGTNGNDALHAIRVDATGRAVIALSANSTDYPLANPIQGTKAGSFYDAALSMLNASGSGLSFSTYLGGANSDTMVDLAVDSGGNAYGVGSTLSTDFPSTAGVIQPTHTVGDSQNTDAFVVKVQLPSDSGPMVQGSAWYSDGSSSKSGPSGTVITVFASGLQPNVSFRVATSPAQANPALKCTSTLVNVNANLRKSNSRGFVPYTSGPVSRAPGTYDVCVVASNGTTMAAPPTFTVT